MKRNLEIRTPIAAPVPAVWQALADLRRYRLWNSRTHFRAAPALGHWQLMQVKLFGLWLPVPVVIQRCDAAGGLRWQGGLPGLFTGSHYFRVEPDGAGAHLIQGEDFDGLLVGPLWRRMEPELLGLYRAFGNALKARCEAPPASR